MLPRGTVAARLRVLEHLVMALILGAGVSVGSVGAIVVGFHRSTLLGAIVIVDVAAALALGAALLNRQRQKAEWARFIASIEPDAAPDAPASLKAHAEALRRMLEVDSVALLLGPKGGPLLLAAHAGSPPPPVEAGKPLPAGSMAARTARPARPTRWATDADGDPLAVAGMACAACTLVTVGDRAGQVVTWSSRPSQRALRRLGVLARTAAESIERSRADEAEYRSRLGASHARTHMALLVAASAAMATAIDDWQPALERLTAAIVPLYADYFAVDVIGPDGATRRLVANHADAARSPSALAAKEATAFRRAAERSTQVFPVFPDRGVARPAADEELEAVHAELGLASWAVIPTRLRGGSTGVLSVGTVAPRRGLRPSDVATYEEVASRCAMAFERVALYQEAATRERRLRTLFDASPSAIIELTPTGELRSWNRAATELFGWSPAATAPELEPAARETLVALRGRLAAGERAVVERATLRGWDGEAPVRVSIAASFIGDDDLLCILTDITQQESMELALQARERMEALGRLAGGIAHDFNNLLTVIVGYSEVLADGLGRDHQLYDDVDAIREAGLRAAAFTEQLLTISRRRVIEGAAVALDDTVRGLEPVLRRLIGADVTFVVECDASAGWVNLEKGQLEQVVLNLVVNARDAMPDGGTLTVTAAPIKGEDGAMWAVLNVTDTGIGMDEATLERCFEPFFTTKGLAKGTGLGLATVYTIVDQAGGAVTADSTPGKGTSIRAMFPTVAAGSAQAASAPQPAGVTPAEATILLVEDDEMVRTYARNVLEGAGYAVFAAANGGEALELAASMEPPCALVADVVMPGLSGPDVAARLPGMPALFISGYIEDERRDLLLEGTPSSGFLAKPFRPDQLLDALHELFALSQGSKR